ncbi:hypothetical protein O0L34_g16691 [Tuta absoluta]|nr:hypothetical protein O0L34_g16691 [Tuta absoluta]
MLKILKILLVLSICMNYVKCNEVPPTRLESITERLKVSAPEFVHEARNPDEGNVNSRGSTGNQNPGLSNTEPTSPVTSEPSVLSAQSSEEYPPCEISETKVSKPGKVCKGQLLFEDNFDSGFDESKFWTPEIRFPRGPDYPFNLYDNNQQIRDGHLIIKPITTQSKYGVDVKRQSLDLGAGCTGIIGTVQCSREPFGPFILPPIITAKITTNKTFSFKFGRVEIGARLPVGEWLYPEIQLEPRDNVYGSPYHYASGVMRIATVKGNTANSKKLYAGPILSESELYRSKYLKEKVGHDDWNKEFHYYSLVWKPDGITLFVDGEQYGEIKPGEGFYTDASEYEVPAASQWQKGSAMAPFDEFFYISLGLNVGGILEFPDTPGKPWENGAVNGGMHSFWYAQKEWLPTWNDDTSSLQVDYVRVYAL